MKLLKTSTFGIIQLNKKKLLKTSTFGIIQLNKISLMSPKSGDNLCAWLFTEAGQMLGRHIRALSRLAGAQIVYLKVEQPVL